MTKSILIIAAVSAFSFSSSAQIETSESPSKWKISSFGLEAGVIRDSYSKMNLETMYDFTQNPALLDRNLSGLSANFYRESYGAKLGANITLSMQRPESSWQHEIRLGAFYSNREPMISYNSFASQEGLDYESIIYCNVVNELSADGAYLLRRSFGKKGWWSYYGGVGMTLGSSFNNELIVMESTFDSETEEFTGNNASYAAKSSLFSRLYIPVGVEVSLFKKVNLGLETNIGVGMQSVFGGKNYFMPFNTGGTLRLSYNI